MTTRNQTRTVLTLAAVAMAILVLTTASAHAGVISYVQVTNDADSGISADNTYTHKLDFGTGSPGALINGVQFDAYNNAANGTLNFNREVFSGNLNEHGGNGGHNVTGSLADLMTDMYYNGDNAAGGTTTWTLSGLTAGETYDTRIYTRQWGPSDSRLATFVFDPDGAGAISDSTAEINQDDATSAGFTNGNDAYYINYQFKAVAGEDLVITATQPVFNYSWHLYGISNQEAVVPNTASRPNPADGSRTPPSGIEGDGHYMLMTFWPGYGATTHTAYFSSNFDDVNDRNPAVSLDSPPFPLAPPPFDIAYYAGLDDANLPDFARTPLERGVTYYWVVDEANDTNDYPGDVWSFTIASEEAWDPTPADGARYVFGEPSVALSWQMGDVNDPEKYIITYDVYWGTDQAAVEAGTSDTINVADPTHPIGPLSGDTDYYWKVDTRLISKIPPNPITIIPGSVWHFTTIFAVPIVDEDLIGWWKLDGDIVPGMAFDSSGYANHGTLTGDAQWVVGYDGGALDFDGADYINIGYSPELSLNDFTLSAWVNIATEPGTFGILGTRVGGDTTFDLKVMADYIHGDIGSGSAWIDTAIDIGSGDTGTNGQGGDLAVGTWYMIAYVIDNTNQQVRLYLDGDLKRTIDISGIPLLMKAGQSMRIGDTGYSEWMNGLIDDVRIYNRVLSIKEIKIVGGLLGALSPDPADGATGVSRSPLLSWEPGLFVADVEGNQLYFSSDATAVANRTATMHPLTDPTYSPGTLDLGATYYWAVDTVSDPCNWPGDVWKFTTVNYLVIDNMDAYVAYDVPAGPHIFVAWRDGKGDCAGSGNDTGANLLESTPLFAGSQLMRYDWDNDGFVLNPCDGTQDDPRPFYYSKITAQVAGLPSGIGSNWTTGGVKALSLLFYGDPANSINDPLWVQLSDGSGPGLKVEYGKYADESLADIQDPNWHEWLIDLADLDVDDLTNVVSISIGVGDEDATGPHISSGTLYIDDVRLYTPRCIPSRRDADFALVDYAPEGTAGGDCVVNYKELDVMSRDWLLFDYDAPPLIAWYEFDGDYTDSSGNGHDGTPVGGSEIGFDTDPDRGQVLTLPGGSNQFVDCGSVGISGAMPRTIACWAKADTETITDWTLVFGFTGNPDGSGGNGSHFNIGCLGGTNVSDGQARGIGGHVWGWEETIFSEPESLEWHHYAMTYDGTTVACYGDGAYIDFDPTVSNNRGLTHADRVHVGSRITQDSSFPGDVDDARIYDRLLTEAEIVSIMDGSLGTMAGDEYHPVVSVANISDDEPILEKVVNFKDYAELMNVWLDEGMFP